MNENKDIHLFSVKNRPLQVATDVLEIKQFMIPFKLIEYRLLSYSITHSFSKAASTAENQSILQVVLLSDELTLKFSDLKFFYALGLPKKISENFSND